MFLIKYIAEVLGLLMNGIFYLLDKIGSPNVGLAIILFTIVMYLLMTPMQVKQQRFSKLQAVMQPELKKIQNKYKNKKDQVSMQKQQEEMQAVYQKYGVSMAGSCGQLAIQMPILFALYQVIYKIPGYITIIREQIEGVAQATGFSSFLGTFVTNLDNAAVTRNFAEGATENIIDTLYGLNSSQWAALLADEGAQKFSTALTSTHDYIQKVTTFLGLSISDAPMALLREGWGTKAFGLIFAAILIPVLAYATQVLSFKLMPQPNAARKGEESQTDATMRQMNMMMPIMSAVFCFTLPVGIGIYWIAGAVVRIVQQIFINRHLEKEGVEEIIRKSKEKAEKKAKKKGYEPQKITQGAQRSVRKLDADLSKKSSPDTLEGANKTFKEGSIASKANLVKNYNDSHKKK